MQTLVLTIHILIALALIGVVLCSVPKAVASVLAAAAAAAVAAS